MHRHSQTRISPRKASLGPAIDNLLEPLFRRDAFLGGYEEKTLTAIMAVAKKHGVNKILAEPNFGGGMFTALLKSVAQKTYPCTVEDAEWTQVRKEERIIDTLEPVLNQHRLVVCPSVIESDYNSVSDRAGERAPAYRLFYQMTRMVKERGALAFDDRVDAFAGAVAYFVKQMAKDTDRAVNEHKDKALDEQLKKFMQGVLGTGGANHQLRSRAGSRKT